MHFASVAVSVLRSEITASTRSALPTSRRRLVLAGVYHREKRTGSIRISYLVERAGAWGVGVEAGRGKGWGRCQRELEREGKRDGEGGCLRGMGGEGFHGCHCCVTLARSNRARVQSERSRQGKATFFGFTR